VKEKINSLEEHQFKEIHFNNFVTFEEEWTMKQELDFTISHMSLNKNVKMRKKG